MFIWLILNWKKVTYLLKKCSDILPALKGYFFKADHRFVVYRLHLHDFIASGYPPRSARPAVDQGLCLQPLTPILNGLGDMKSPRVAFPYGTRFNMLYKVLVFKFYPASCCVE